MSSNPEVPTAPRNQWYVAAWSREVTRQPFERWILDEPVALYRTGAGQPVALAGRCPHHFFPLGKSGCEGDNIRCGYHGLTFAPDGRCVDSPFMERIPPACRVKSYRLAERWQWLWIWPGDPELADESRIPDHREIGLTDPGFLAWPAHFFEVDARYQLLNDNLLDLSHLEVLHSGNAGTAGIGMTEEHRDIGDDWVSSFRTMADVPIAPVFQEFFGYTGPVNRTFGLKFYAPGLHAGYDDLECAGNGPDTGRHLGRFNVYHAITPARRNASSYFFALGRDFKLDDEAFTRQVIDVSRHTLEEDVFAAVEIEKQLHAAGPGCREQLFHSDATLVAGRRIMESLLDDEREPGTARAAR